MHSEQVADTSSLNMFFDDEVFSNVVLGDNFFRVAGILTTFAAPPICRDDHISEGEGEPWSTRPNEKELGFPGDPKLGTVPGTWMASPTMASPVPGLFLTSPTRRFVGNTSATDPVSSINAGTVLTYIVAMVAIFAASVAVVRTYCSKGMKAALIKRLPSAANIVGSEDDEIVPEKDGTDYVAFANHHGHDHSHLHTAPGVARLGSKICEHCQPLRHETNVIVLHRLGLLQRLASVNLGLALASILYFACSLVLLIISTWPEAHVVDGGAFHYLDFGGAALFSFLEVLTLLYSPERRFTSPTLLRILMFFSVCSTSVGFLLIALNRSVFEYIAHNINYINDFVVALVDSLLVSTVVRSPAHHPGQGGGHLRTGVCGKYGAHIAVLATLVPLTLSFGQVFVYNCSGVDWRGHMLGERNAHVLEFCFTMIGAAINFWFCLDSRMLAEELTRQIMIAPDEMVVVLDPSGNTSIHTADECGRPEHLARMNSLSPRSRPTPGPCTLGCCTHDHDHSVVIGDVSHSHDHAVIRNPNGSALTELLLPPDVASGSR